MDKPPLASSITPDAMDVRMARRSSSMEQLEQHEYLTTNHLPYANMTMASLLNAHIANVNSERQALWLRYGTMLQANALLYGFFLTAETLTTLQVAFAAGLGLVLCMTWLVMTISSFRLFSLRLDVASRLARSELDAISEYANPVSSAIPWRYGPRGRWLFPMMVQGIVLFMFAYTFLIVHHLYYMFVFVEGPR
jgi:hypothetical protein